jgi:hypothetical protein
MASDEHADEGGVASVSNATASPGAQYFPMHFIASSSRQDSVFKWGYPIVTPFWWTR